MPTSKPHPDVLPLESPSPAVDAIVHEAVEKLTELRNFGTFAYAWVGQTPPPDALRIVPMLLFRHALEEIDAITVMIANHIVDPAMVNLRVLMETWLFVQFLVEKDTPDRAAAYMVWYFHRRQDRFRRYQSTTEVGKEFRAEIKKDDSASDSLFDKFTDGDVQESIDRIDRILQQEEYVKAEKMYQEAIKLPKNQRPKTWHQLVGSGAPSTQRLAEYLGCGASYDELNRTLSGIIHASDILSGRISRSDDGMGAFKQIRLLNNFNFVVGMTITYGWSIYRYCVDRYAPFMGDEVREWYGREIRDYLLNRLPKIKISYDE